jgi:dihydrofolate reductase
MAELIRETGAVVLGRRTFAMAQDPDWYVGNYEFQVPIFVVTHTPPAVLPAQDENLTFTFVTDGIASAVKQAKAAAGDRAVKVIGASVVRQAVRAWLADELHVLIAWVPGCRCSATPISTASRCAGSACVKSGRTQNSASRCLTPYSG